MKLLNRKKLILVAALLVVWLLGAGSAFGQAPANGTPEGRALELKDLLGSIEGTPREATQIFKTPNGYLRFVGAPPSTNFPVDPNRRATPQEAADAFVEEYRNLFVNVSPAVGFDVHRVNTHDSRSYVRYRQTYAGLEVFGAEVIVQVNAVGGIAAADTNNVIGVAGVSWNCKIMPIRIASGQYWFWTTEEWTAEKEVKK